LRKKKAWPSLPGLEMGVDLFSENWLFLQEYQVYAIDCIKDLNLSSCLDKITKLVYEKEIDALLAFLLLLYIFMGPEPAGIGPGGI
jgi:hypothetical protein